ncbi:MAG: heat shock protein HspQ, partial [Methylicorpusculum sp.]
YQPWYHVLVDNAKHQTYVAESNLSVSDNSNPINNPFLENYFSGLKNGIYQLNLPKN